MNRKDLISREMSKIISGVNSQPPKVGRTVSEKKHKPIIKQKSFEN